MSRWCPECSGPHIGILRGLHIKAKKRWSKGQRVVTDAMGNEVLVHRPAICYMAMCPDRHYGHLCPYDEAPSGGRSGGPMSSGRITHEPEED